MKTTTLARILLLAVLISAPSAALADSLAPWVASLSALLNPQFSTGKVTEKAGRRLHFAAPKVNGVSILDLTKLRSLPSATRVMLSTKGQADFEGARWGATQRPCWIAGYGSERWYRIDSGPLQNAILQVQRFDDSVQAFLMTENYVLNDDAMEPKVREHAMKCLPGAQ